MNAPRNPRLRCDGAVPRDRLSCDTGSFTILPELSTTSPDPKKKDAGRPPDLSEDQVNKGYELLKQKLQERPFPFRFKSQAVSWLRSPERGLGIAKHVRDLTVQRWIVDDLWPPRR